MTIDSGAWCSSTVCTKALPKEPVPPVTKTVLPSSAIYDKKPDVVVVLAWNFAEPIIDKHAAFRQAGGRFLVPLPTIEMH